MARPGSRGSDDPRIWEVSENVVIFCVVVRGSSIEIYLVVNVLFLMITLINKFPIVNRVLAESDISCS